MGRVGEGGREGEREGDWRVNEEREERVEEGREIEKGGRSSADIFNTSHGARAMLLTFMTSFPFGKVIRRSTSLWRWRRWRRWRRWWRWLCRGKRREGGKGEEEESARGEGEEGGREWKRRGGGGREEREGGDVISFHTPQHNSHAQALL